MKEIENHSSLFLRSIVRMMISWYNLNNHLSIGGPMKKTALLVVLTIFAILQSMFFTVSAEVTEADFFELYDEFGSIVLLINPVDGSIDYVNQAAVRFYGYSKEVLLTMNINQINTLSPEEIALEMANAEALSRNYFEFRHRLANQAIRYVHVYSYPIIIDGESYLFSIVHDVTEQVQAQELSQTLLYLLLFLGFLALTTGIIVAWYQFLRAKELAAKNQEIQNFDILRQTFIDEQTEIVYLKDEHYRYLFVNKAFEHFYQLTKDQVLGKTDQELGQDEAFTKRKQETDEEVVKKQKRVIYEVPYLNQVLEATKFPVLLLNGHYGIGAIVKNITEEITRRQKEQKSMARVQLVSDILSRNFVNSEEQFRYTANQIARILDCEFVLIQQLNRFTGQYEIRYTNDAFPSFHLLQNKAFFDLNQSSNPFQKVVIDKQPILVGKLDEFHWKKEHYLSIRELAILPFEHESAVQSILFLMNKEGGFQEFDLYQTRLLMNATFSVTMQKSLSTRLSVERQKYLQTLLSIGDAVIVTNHLGVIEVINPVAQNLTAWKEEEAIGVHFEQVLTLLDERLNPILTPIQQVLETNQAQTLNERTILLNRYGETTYIEDSATPLFDEHQQLIGVVMVFRDVTKLVEQQKSIEFALHHDTLTKLYNRYYFEHQVRSNIGTFAFPLAVIFCDVNGLKFTNDVFGHQQGDELLLAAVRNIKQTVPQDSIVSRVGGDEFIILCPGMNAEQAYSLKHQIKSQFAKEDVNGLKGSISIGYQVADSNRESFEDVLREAERFMYQEKVIEHQAFSNHSLDQITNQLFSLHKEEHSHSIKVERLTTAFAQYLELPSEEVEKLGRAARYHDLGKVVWPKSIFEKKTELDEKELGLIRQHVIVSYRILNAIESTVDVADIVLSHHERVDGLGYPKGLKQSQISRFSRILSIVEAYVAMTSPRPYKKQKTIQGAISELFACSGTQFDPQLVVQFVSFLRSESSESQEA